jgi:hypothetical protein
MLDLDRIFSVFMLGLDYQSKYLTIPDLLLTKFCLAHSLVESRLGT